MSGKYCRHLEKYWRRLEKYWRRLEKYCRRFGKYCRRLEKYERRLGKYERVWNCSYNSSAKKNDVATSNSVHFKKLATKVALVAPKNASRARV
ncbi:MAG: hypothetical protein K6D37_07730 [Prevotella sp.]|nr:hypothetical protein [Prevotella sp.]